MCMCVYMCMYINLCEEIEVYFYYKLYIRFILSNLNPHRGRFNVDCFHACRKLNSIDWIHDKFFLCLLQYELPLSCSLIYEGLGLVPWIGVKIAIHDTKKWA